MSEQENQIPATAKRRTSPRHKSVQSKEKPNQQTDTFQSSTIDEHITKNALHQTPPEPKPSNSDEEISKASYSLFEHIEGQIKLADTKAQLTLAADALLVLAFASLNKGAAIRLLGNSTPVLDRIAALFTILMFLALVCSFYYALLVVKPHLRKSQRPTLMYFGQIVQLSEEEFISNFLDQSLDQLKESVLTEVYAKAKIAKSKFTKVRHSVNFLIVALVLWAVVQLLLAFVR
jgi:hypothetical protein